MRRYALNYFVTKYGSFSRKSYIVYMKGHKNSKGESAPWVIKSHEDGHIISSHKTKAEAEKHLKQIQYFKHKKKGVLSRRAALKIVADIFTAGPHGGRQEEEEWTPRDLYHKYKLLESALTDKIPADKHLLTMLGMPPEYVDRIDNVSLNIPKIVSENPKSTLPNALLIRKNPADIYKIAATLYVFGVPPKKIFYILTGREPVEPYAAYIGGAYTGSSTLLDTIKKKQKELEEFFSSQFGKGTNLPGAPFSEILWKTWQKAKAEEKKKKEQENQKNQKEEGGA